MKPHERMGISAALFWTRAFEHSAIANPRQRDDVAEEAFWQDYAPHYDVRSPLASLAGVIVADVIALLQPGDRLLEIGPGSGAFTCRLAAHVGAIAGVEPSAAMRETLVRQWPKTCGSVPRLIAGKWEDSTVPYSDVVFAANALYRVRDIGPALRKMTAYAARHVMIVQTIGRPHAGPLVVPHDGTVLERERADALSDVLDEMGIAHRRRVYSIDRGDTEPCDVALIDWPTAGEGA